MHPLLQSVALHVVDGVYRIWPQRRPAPEVLRRARIISHRGEHDNKSVYENTLEAFRCAAAAGVWGLETDIRWSADLVPLAVHDPDGARLFGDPGHYSEMSFAEIRQRMPLVPSLQELIAEFGGRMHLMLEIKEEPWSRLEEQQRILRELLSGLRPGADYHILALDPALFQRVDFLPPQTCFPVAETNVSALSEAALQSGFGGLTGHFLLLNRSLQARHEAAGQRIGTGFISSRNCLYRELNRGVEWIFSNHALRLQAILEEALNDSSPA